MTDGRGAPPPGADTGTRHRATHVAPAQTFVAVGGGHAGCASFATGPPLSGAKISGQRRPAPRGQGDAGPASGTTRRSRRRLAHVRHLASGAAPGGRSHTHLSERRRPTLPVPPPSPSGDGADARLARAGPPAAPPEAAAAAVAQGGGTGAAAGGAGRGGTQAELNPSSSELNAVQDRRRCRARERGARQPQCRHVAARCSSVFACSQSSLKGGEPARADAGG